MHVPTFLPGQLTDVSEEPLDALVKILCTFGRLAAFLLHCRAGTSDLD